MNKFNFKNEKKDEDYLKSFCEKPEGIEDEDFKRLYYSFYKNKVCIYVYVFVTLIMNALLLIF